MESETNMKKAFTKSVVRVQDFKNLGNAHKVFLKKTDKKYKTLMLFGIFTMIVGLVLGSYSLNSYAEDIKWQKENTDEFVSVQSDIRERIFEMKIFANAGEGEEAKTLSMQLDNQYRQTMPELPSDSFKSIALDVWRRMPSVMVALVVVLVGLITFVSACSFAWWNNE